MIKFWSYVFYRFIEYYKSDNDMLASRIYSFMGIGALVMLNAFAIVAFIGSYFKINLIGYYLTNDSYHNKFVIIPILISPIFIMIYIIYRVKKETFETYIKQFFEISFEEKKRYNRKFWGSIVFTGAFFLLSIVSSSFFK